jgi:enoyl-CoA hydratase/carnithine racemase
MPDLIYEKREHYAVFTMNRPERLNALGGSMSEQRLSGRYSSA